MSNFPLMQMMRQVLEQHTVCRHQDDVLFKDSFSKPHPAFL